MSEKQWRTRTAVGLVAICVLLVALTPIASAQTTRCGDVPATIVGTEGNDVLTGTPGRDVIVGLGGNDRINGLGGHDIICGGAGRDRIVGGQGRDYLNGGPGRDRILGNAGNDVLVGASGNDILDGGSGFDRVKGGGGDDTCQLDLVVSCDNLELAAPTSTNPTVDLVVHISIDGLRSDFIGPDRMPNLTALRARGASTLNARTDEARTQTLPNHTSQFTSRPVLGPNGHQVNFNFDNDRTVHNQANRYIRSVFDVVHDNGGRTAVYAGKSKFDFIDRSWNGVNGATDFVGESNGRDKIDVYSKNSPEENAELFREDLALMGALEFAFFHIRYPDEVGHIHGWGSAEYAQAVEDADALLGEVVQMLDEDDRAVGIIITSDHGGPTGGLFHNVETIPDNYTIPMVVVAPGAANGADLYRLNTGRRVDPGRRQVGNSGPQPIRGHEMANLALDLLGYDAIDGSSVNSAQDLRIR